MNATCDQAKAEVGNGVAAALRAVDCTANELTGAAFGRLFAPGGAMGPTLTILLAVARDLLADNDGAQPVDEPIVAGGPAAYFSTLPLKAMLRDLRAAGVPAEVSQTAGTYVCNHVLYGLMHALRRTPRVRGGFVHIPFAPDQAARHPGAPSLPVEVVVQGLRVMLRSALTTNTDIRLAAGATH